MVKILSSNSKDGKELETVCCSHGLTQHIKLPTRGLHLLDLVMSNFSSGIRCKVVQGIRDNDHAGVLTIVNVRIPAPTPVRRLVYDYKQADWSRLKTELSVVHWGKNLQEVSSDEGANWLTNTILYIVDENIPSKWITDKPFSHLWINDACHAALRIKCGGSRN